MLSVDFAWVTAFTATGAAVAGYALGRLDRRRKSKRGGMEDVVEKDGEGSEDSVQYEEPVEGTRKRKLGFEISVEVRKRARPDSAPKLRTPESTLARRGREQDADGTLTDTDDRTLPHPRAISPPRTASVVRRHTRTGLLTPAGSSDYHPEENTPYGGTHSLRGQRSHSGNDNDVTESDLEGLDSDSTVSRVRATSRLLHAILPSPFTPARPHPPQRTRKRFTTRPRPHRRRRNISLTGSTPVKDGYESGISAPPSEESDSDCSYHEGSDASSYDSRASSPGLNVPSDEETFWDGSEAESDAEDV